MERVKNFLSMKKRQMTIVFMGLQGLAGIAVGSYFIRPVIVGTAAVAVTNPVYAKDCGAGMHWTGCECERDSKVTAAVAVIAASNASKSTSTSTSTGTSTATSCTTCRMFVTTSTYTGAAIGGITGADAKCASDSTKPSTGTYKAFLVDDVNRYACTTANCSGGASENKNWVIKASTAYTRVDGTAIATSTAAGLLPAALTNPISTTGDSMLGTIRTGMAFAKDWTSRVNGHCTNYSSTSGSSTDGDGNGSTNSSYLYVNGGPARMQKVFSA